MVTVGGGRNFDSDRRDETATNEGVSTPFCTTARVKERALRTSDDSWRMRPVRGLTGVNPRPQFGKMSAGGRYNALRVKPKSLSDRASGAGDGGRGRRGVNTSK